MTRYAPWILAAIAATSISYAQVTTPGSGGSAGPSGPATAGFPAAGGMLSTTPVSPGAPFLPSAPSTSGLTTPVSPGAPVSAIGVPMRAVVPPTGSTFSDASPGQFDPNASGVLRNTGSSQSTTNIISALGLAGNGETGGVANPVGASAFVQPTTYTNTAAVSAPSSRVTSPVLVINAATLATTPAQVYWGGQSATTGTTTSTGTTSGTVTTGGTMFTTGFGPSAPTPPAVGNFNASPLLRDGFTIPVPGQYDLTGTIRNTNPQ